MRRADEPLFASVNVSSRQLLRQDLIQDLRTVLARSSVTRGTLKLELTESLVMENPEHAAQLLDAAARTGRRPRARRFRHRPFVVVLSAAFPVRHHQDRPVLRAHESNKGTRPVILRSIIALAHDLGMEVVAEGAETDSDAVELLSDGLRIRAGLRVRSSR